MTSSENSNLTETQRILLIMLKDFHQFCQKYSIQYYIIGGTFLGAVRHKGFIPWDDDIDVGIPREDYNKLFNNKSKLPDYLRLMTTGYKKNTTSYAYAKLCNRETTLIENLNERRIEGIYIDIFPLDGAGNSMLESKLVFMVSRFLTRLLSINGSDNNFKGWRRLVTILVQKIDNEKLQKKITNQLSKKSFHDNKYVGNLLGAYKYREVILRTIFGSPSPYIFEEIEVYGPEISDQFLKHIYGNYMELPPKEERQSHHEYELINLEKGFETYD